MKNWENIHKVNAVGLTFAGVLHCVHVLSYHHGSKRLLTTEEHIQMMRNDGLNQATLCDANDSLTKEDVIITRERL